MVSCLDFHLFSYSFIVGLLPLLKSIQKPCHLKKFAGQTIGVDAYGWLHRGTVACAIDLALGKPTTKHACPSPNEEFSLTITQIRRFLYAPSTDARPLRRDSVYCFRW